MVNLVETLWEYEAPEPAALTAFFNPLQVPNLAAYLKNIPEIRVMRQKPEQYSFVTFCYLDIRVSDPGCLSRIPDPNFFHPGSGIKEFKYFNPKNCF